MSSSESPRCVVVMPRYGDVSLGAAQAYHAPNTYQCDPEMQIRVAAWSSAAFSLATHSMNILLAAALDHRDRGLATHIAMIHSDVEPEGHWLNLLWAEMRTHDADLVSAVIPIKEPSRQKTSTAIGVRSDPWKVDRYILDSHRDTLPETFGPEHVCGPDEVLLVNTGLWLADLRRPWWDCFAFQLHSRVIVEDGRRVAQIRPEDWELSRYLDAHGARYMATWRVPLVHRGQAGWPNQPGILS